MRRFRLKALLALVLAVCMSLTSLPGGFAFADELKTESTEAPFWESLDDESKAEFDLTEALTLDEVEEEAVYSDDDVVRVFIVFEDESVVEAGYSTEDIAANKAAMNYSDALEATQDEVIAQIEEKALEGAALDKNYSFTLFTNAVSADVKYKDLEEIEAVDGVSAVYIAPIYETLEDPQTMTAGEMVGSYRTWESGYTGAGTKIAIVDTGIDVNHPSFSEDGYLYSLKETADELGKAVGSFNVLKKKHIEANLENLNAYSMYAGLTADDLYVNAKIPYGFNYVDRNLNLKHVINSDGTHDDHGSHVAGIAAANKYINYDGEYSTEKLGVVGIAPDAQLMVMRVFGVNGGAYPDDYMAAIEDAVLLGADSINLSLGSASAGETASGEAYFEEVLDRVADSSTILVISAGNSGSFADSSVYGANLTEDVNLDTVGSPGSYTNAFTVASATNSSITGYGVIFNDSQVVNYINGSSAPNRPMASLDVNGTGTEYEYVIIPSYGEEKDFANVDVEGKIVLVSRGEISFYVKHLNAAAAGAIGLFVYNNQPGTISMNLSGSDATIPAASITLAAAQELSVNSVFDEATGTYTGKVLITSDKVTNFNVPDGFLMSSFSSWGVPGDLALKPEITAPGGNIYSTTDEGTYDVMSGTSMAAPSVAGLSALVLQYIKENKISRTSRFTKRVIAQSLLMSTATPLAQEDGVLYSPRKQGAGLANAAAATSSPVFAIVGSRENNDGKVKAELGDDPSRTGKYQFYFYLYNIAADTAYFKFDSTVLTEKVLEDYFIANSSYELGATSKFAVGYNKGVLLYDLDENGVVNNLDVNVLLRYINRKDANAKVDTFPEDFDFSKNGTIDVTDAALFLQAVLGINSKVNLKEQVIAVKGNDREKVNVTINLTNDDKNYLDTNFENGMYVDGFVQLDGKIDLSIPFLAFYGNWSDSSMFDHFDGMAALAGDENQVAYNGISLTNYLTYQFAGDSKSYYFAPNMYEDDAEYIADRNAISSLSGDKIAAFNYTLIRNAASLSTSVTNAETGEVYLSEDYGRTTATYYSVNQARWYNTKASAKINWAGTDAEGNALPDGTKVNVNVTAYPSYYVKNPSAPLGKGINLTIPVTVDNTAPVGELVEYTEAEKDVSGNVITPGKITAKVSDNRYVAAVYLVGADKSTLINSFAVNQTEAGEATEITFEYPQQLFYVYVIDYAGNTSIYRINASGEPDVTIAESLTLSSEYLTIVKGGTAKLEATVGPDSIVDNSVTWVSLDESIATIDENGVVTGVSEGKAVVGAVTNALGADGEPLVAACVVEVITIEVDFNTTLWDEEGGVYFGTFNSADLTLKNLSERQSVAFVATSLVDGTLYAVSQDSSNDDGSLYKVNPNTFENEYVGELAAINADVAYGIGTERLYGVYSYYLVVQTTDGEFEGAYDLSRYIGFEDATGITYITSVFNNYYGVYVDIFYFIDSAGVVYTLYVYGDLGINVYVAGETGISTNGEYLYSSLYYDDETNFIFYSCYDGSDDVTFYAIADYYDEATDEEWVEVSALGQFATKVWPVSGLYQWDNEDGANKNAHLLKAVDGEIALNTAKVSDITKKSSSLKKQPVLADKDEVAEEAPAEEVSENEEAPVEAAPVEEEAPAEDVSDNEEAPAEDVSENETAPVEEVPAEEEP
ncbi:MAG: S8 family serine peptidase [Lachnospiraceae bacterium]|nr:S8 family serine peptidase [Lachnospiraceae bacterium]